MKSARKLFLLLLIFSISICCLPGCKKSELDKNKPVTLTMWHVYGEQADSPMNRLIDLTNLTRQLAWKKALLSMSRQCPTPPK